MSPERFYKFRSLDSVMSEPQSSRMFPIGLHITLGLGVVGGFEKRPPGTEAQLKN